MPITKTNFINYSRCPRYAALDNIKKEKLLSDISYDEYLEEENLSPIEEIKYRDLKIISLNDMISEENNIKWYRNMI